MNIVDRIDSLVKTSDVHSIKALEKELNFGNGTIGKWRKQSPSCDKVKAVADFLQTSIDYLVSGNVDNTEMSVDEQELLENYRKSSRMDKARIQERAMVCAENAAESLNEDHITMIKLFDSSVSAGTGIYVDYTGYENIETQEDTDGADYAVKVSGNSMEPRFYDGDIVLVEIAQTVEVGEIGIFNLNGQAYIKQRGENALISLNKEYAPIPIASDDSIYCQGRVIKVLSTKMGA